VEGFFVRSLKREEERGDIKAEEDWERGCGCAGGSVGEDSSASYFYDASISSLSSLIRIFVFSSSCIISCFGDFSPSSSLSLLLSF